MNPFKSAKCVAVPPINAPIAKHTGCRKCKPVPLEKLREYLKDRRKMHKYLKRFLQCRCGSNTRPWEALSEFEQRRRECDEECSVLERVVEMLEMPQLIYRELEELPRFEIFPENTWIICSFFNAFGQCWSARFKLVMPPRAKSPVRQAQLQCIFVYVLHLESPETCPNPLRLSYTLGSSEFMDMRFEANLCENYNFTQYTLDGPPAELLKDSFENMQRRLKEKMRFRIFIAPANSDLEH